MRVSRPAALRPCLPAQALGRWAVGVPRGDPKKTDEAPTQEQLDTLDKFKGEGWAGWVVGQRRISTVEDGRAGATDRAPHASLLPGTPPTPTPTRAHAESAYKCSVQILFTVVLLLISVRQP